MARETGSKTTRLDRATVIEAACTLANTEGFEAMSLASLSSVLGRHASSMYNHVAGLDGLRRDVTIKSLHVLSDELRGAVLGKGGTEGLRAIADVWRTYADLRPGQFQAVISWRRYVDAADEEITGAYLPGVEAMHAVMASLGLSGRSIDYATRGLTSAIVGFIIVSNGAFYGSASSVDEAFDELVRLFQIALQEKIWPSAD